MTAAPALIAIDWGTSSLRGFLLDSAGAVIETRQTSHGIARLPRAAADGGFALAYHELLGDWPLVPALASGMVGSRQGWLEAPYARCPTDLVSLADQMVAVDTERGALRIAPGVLFDDDDANPDVMRGEEVQILGALADRRDWSDGAAFVLPGTHSKWAEVRGNRLLRFATFMTGELHALLMTHSILAAMAASAADAAIAQPAAFERGLAAAQGRDLTHQLFVTRALGLRQRLDPLEVSDYVSGLLIGHEFACRPLVDDVPLVLIGAPALTLRYARAADLLGIAVAQRLDNTAHRGLWHLAIAAGLIR